MLSSAWIPGFTLFTDLFIVPLVLFQAVQEKLDQMVFLWSDIQALVEEREAKLLDVMDLADKFWCDHCALIVTIKDSQDLLRELEEPGVDPSVVKQQQEFVEVRLEIKLPQSTNLL